jgi:hypothetical protein
MTVYKEITVLRRAAKQLRDNVGAAATIKPEFHEELAKAFEARANRIEAGAMRRRSKKHPRT